MKDKACVKCLWKDLEVTSEPCKSCWYMPLANRMSNFALNSEDFWIEADKTLPPLSQALKGCPGVAKEDFNRFEALSDGYLMPAGPEEKANSQQAAAQKPLDTQVGGSHYKTLKIQPIEYIHANQMDYCEANIVKYISRWRDKGGIKDLQKVKHYVDLLIQLEGLRDE